MLEILGPKPWVVWNGKLITGSNEIQGYDTYKDVLYGSQIDPYPKISRFPSNWNDADITQDVAIPRIRKITNIGNTETTADTGAIKNQYQVCYLLIPINERGEAGHWYYFPYANGSIIDQGMADIANDINTRFRVEVNGATSYVEVWKTRQRSATDFTNPAYEIDTSFYYVTTAHRRTVLDVETERTAMPGIIQAIAGDVDPTQFYLTNTDEIYLKDPANTGFLFNQAQNWIGRILVFDEVPNTNGSVDPNKNYRIVSVLADSYDPLGTIVVKLVDHETSTPVSFNYNDIHPIVVTSREVVLDEDNTVTEYTIQSETHSQVVITESADLGFDTVEFGDSLHLTEDSETFTSEGLPILDRTPNLHADWTAPGVEGVSDYPVVLSTNGAKSPAARALFNSSGVMLWGNVKYPTKSPAVFYLHKGVGGNPGRDIRLQLEYNTSEGYKYGPLMQIDGVYYVAVKAQDESGCLVYLETVAGNNDWRLYDRVTSTNSVGWYQSTIGINPHWTFDLSRFDSDILTNDQLSAQKDVLEYIHEPRTILLSRVDRPAEILVAGATTVSDQTQILAITSARLAEEEGIRNYEMYVFTGSKIWVAQRTEDVIAFDLVTASFGLKFYNTYVITKDGICFFASDNNLYFLSGRQLSTPPINDNVRGIFSIIYDMAYDVSEDEVWCLTETGIWIYSLKYQAWIANYDYNNDDYDVIFYYPDSDIIAREKTTKLPFIFKDRGEWLDSEVTTNRFIDGPIKSKVEQIEIDYASQKSTITFSVTSGSSTVSITGSGGDLFSTTLDAGALMVIPGAGVGGKDMKAQILTVSNANSAVIDRPVETSSSTGTLKWTNTVEVNHNVRSSDIDHTFKVFQRRPVYPRLRGTGHQLKIRNFRELREVVYVIEQSPGAN